MADKNEINKKRRNTCLERYGDASYSLYGSESFKANMKAKYGSEHYNNMEKIQRTCLERYGVKCTLELNSEGRSQKIWDEQHDEIINKRNRTNNERYGANNFIETDEFREKVNDTLTKKHGSVHNAYVKRYEASKKTKLEKYGDEYYRDIDGFKQTLEERHVKFEKENDCTRYTYVLEKYGQGWNFAFKNEIPVIYRGRYRYVPNEYIENTIKPYAEVCHYVSQVSSKEKELRQFISDITTCRIYNNVKNIISDEQHTYELDIYIPKLKIAFEFNGSYWHSTKNKDKYYHQTKTKLCYEHGIQLVHIYEHQWDKDKDNIKEHIKQLLEGVDCSIYNWIPANSYNEYELGEPNEINFFNKSNEVYLTVYDEGTFRKKK